ncbi:MAG: ASKHA domain-containing protein [Candidatus Poribacteria bacterium]
MSQYTVTFYPENIQVIAQEGDNLLEIAQQADVLLTSSCGGNGVCGKCKVIIRKGDVHAEPTKFIDQRERRQGYVLACTTLVHSDLEVEIPPESRLEDEQFLIGEEEIIIEEELEREEAEFQPQLSERAQFPSIFTYPFPSLTAKLHLSLSPPSLQDNVDDLERLFREIRRGRQIPIMQTGLVNLKNLGGFLRENNWDVTVLLGKRGGTTELILMEAGDTSAKNYGIVVDIGTTTIVAHLVDLKARKTIGTTATSNSQREHGADVITRIIYAAEGNGLDILHKSVVDDINGLIVHLTRRNRIDLNDVTCVMCAGNATMTHLFLGVDPTYIRREPYVPTANFFPVIRAAEAGIRINRRGLLSCMPGVSSYVGGDITAGALACGISESEEVCLFIDIGTNGEMVLGNREWLVCCSCSCGPAFEGSGIQYGMRAGRGAIQRVTISDSDYDVKYSTIGNDRPRGVCGSGLIDVLGEMLRAGVIDKAGRIQSDLHTPRYQENEQGPEFILAWKEETAGASGDIVITQADIDNLMRSKAAVYAAALVMMEKMGMTWDDIERIYVGGAFGNYLNIEKSVLIGLLPDLPLEKYRFIGNSSITGAKLAMLSTKSLARAEEIANKMTYIELSADNTFMEQFTAAIFLPHTDMSLFPSVEAKL